MEKKRLTSRGFETAPTKSEWGLFLAVTAVFFFQYFYFDIAVTTQQGMNFWDCVRSGNLMEFYNVNYGVGALTHFDFGDTSMYYLPLYLVFAVWPQEPSFLGARNVFLKQPLRGANPPRSAGNRRPTPACRNRRRPSPHRNG